MRRILIGAVLALVVLPAWAQNRDENRANCLSDDPDTAISGCTADIQSGQETIPTVLAIAYINRGVAYSHKSSYDQAISDFTKAIELKPDDADAYNNRGGTYELKGFHDQAIADYTQAIALQPNDADAYSDRGGAYELKGQRDQAIADYRAALKIAPNLKEAQDGLKRLGDGGGNWLQVIVWVLLGGVLVALLVLSRRLLRGRLPAPASLMRQPGLRWVAISGLGVAVIVAVAYIAFDIAGGPRQASAPTQPPRQALSKPIESVAAFDQPPPSKGLGGADLDTALRAQGMTLIAPPDQPVVVIDQNNVYGGEAVAATRGRNVLVQSGGHPCQYTLAFINQPPQSVSFNRSHLKAGPSGVTHPVWTATALDANGSVLSSVGEPEIRSYTDVPANRFTLSGPGISRITFWGDDKAFDGFCNVVIDTVDIQK